MSFNEINCPPVNLDTDKIRVGDRVSFRWSWDIRRFGVVRDILPWGDRVRYGVAVDNTPHVWDVWSFDITKDVG